MTRPRSQLVSLDATPYYHCISRCVRQAYLCGEDRFSGKTFDHRKPWLVERLAVLADVFAIEIAAYSVMSNHYHLVLHINSARARAWTMDEVIRRWTTLYKGPDLVQQYKAGDSLPETDMLQLAEIVDELRGKLACISKFMACLNEFIARKANLEDGCTGRFWEGRFKSQALLDEVALLSCMAYVDLNPIRAGIASDLEKSDFASIQDRIRQIKAFQVPRRKRHESDEVVKPVLMPFKESLQERDAVAVIPYNLKDYLELTDWTGRVIRPNKRGNIQKTTPQLIQTLGLSDAQWKIVALEIQKQSITMLNGLDTLAAFQKRAAKQKAA
ncbi:MAG: transposase [Pseudohongiellaceae bacterium]